VTGTGDTHDIRGTAGISPEARMTLNARVHLSPDALDTAVRETLDSSANGQIKVTPLAWRCLSPGRPNPTHRYSYVVAADNS